MGPANDCLLKFMKLRIFHHNVKPEHFEIIRQEIQNVLQISVKNIFSAVAVFFVELISYFHSVITKISDSC